jgi:hypothetical protein
LLLLLLLHSVVYVVRQPRRPIETSVGRSVIPRAASVALASIPFVSELRAVTHGGGRDASWIRRENKSEEFYFRYV